jgi:hypothetical protein
MKLTNILFQMILPAAALAVYEGKYFLLEVFDGQDEPVQLPIGRFDMQVSRVESETEADRYRFSLKVGNVLGGGFEVDQADNTQIKFGPIRSTMMMPPKEVYDLEIKLAKMLPASTSLQTQGDTLEFKGVEGRVAFKKDTDSD